MLFHVEVHFPFVQGDISLQQVGHILAHELVALLLQDGFHALFEQVGVRALGLAVLQFLLGGSAIVSAFAAPAAAGHQGGGHESSQTDDQ